jgi:hypothetical protein
MTAEEAEAALVGTWRSSELGPFDVVLDTLEQTMTFGPAPAKEASGTTTPTYKADAAPYQGCAELDVVSGRFLVSGEPGKLLLSLQYDTGATTRTGCADPSGDVKDQPAAKVDLSTANSTGSGPIMLSNGALNLTTRIRGTEFTWTFVRNP